MKQQYVFLSTKTGLLFGISLMLGSSNLNATSPEREYVSIEKQLAHNNIRVQIFGKGGHEGNCILFNVENLTSDSLFIAIEPGRRLVSEDPSMQDILIVKANNFSLPGNEKTKVNGYGFCCMSHNSSPAPNSKFKIGYMAPPDWVALAEFINDNNFPESAIQSAVWVFSNNNDVSSICTETAGDAFELKSKVAEMKGIEFPWYSIKYEREDGRLFSGNPKRLYGQIDYYLDQGGIVTVIVRNKKGKIVSKPVEGIARGPGGYSYGVNLDVRSWPKGEYEVDVYLDNSNLKHKRTFKL